MVAFKYRWLAAFLPFIDIKKSEKALLAILCLRIFRLIKKQTHYNLPSPSNQPAGTFIFKLCGIIVVSTSYTERLSSCDINN